MVVDFTIKQRWSDKRVHNEWPPLITKAGESKEYRAQVCLQLLSRLSRRGPKLRSGKICKSSSCLQKISQACPAHERSRRSRSHRQITLPGFFLVVTGKFAGKFVQTFCCPEKHVSSPLVRQRGSRLPLDRPKRAVQRRGTQGRYERRRSAPPLAARRKER